MPQTPTALCMYTKVRNTTDKNLYFGYLGAHGRYVNAGETYDHKGNLINQLSERRKKRAFDSFTTALEAGEIEIVHTPAVILEDIDSGRPRQLALFGDALGVVDPCWDSTGSSNFDAT